ncbi:kinase-like protein [Tothia fuscella]|uniref:non-specific serine/threonine protein kinase n=1 Tax=Tothia fuscella TaxID=1048955 RepID=A0A9P4U457_9PEZI|nr:kinase-like protein [Tothia fuscella]
MTEGNKVKILKKLGSGVQGEAFLCEHKEHGIVVVKRSRDPQKKITSEANLLASVLLRSNFPYIVHLLSYSTTATTLDLMFRHCDSGDLGGYIKNPSNLVKGYPTMQIVRQVQVQLGAALVWLHTGAVYDCDAHRVTTPAPANWNTIVHRDIKPANVFLTSNPYSTLPNIVLGDFGAAITKRPYDSVFKAPREAFEDPNPQHEYTDPVYAPPEYQRLCVRINEGDRTIRLDPHPSFDIWQYGAVLFEMVCRDGYAAQRSQLIPGRIFAGSGLRAEIEALLELDSRRRPTDEQILQRLAEWHLKRDQAMPEPGHGVRTHY